MIGEFAVREFAPDDKLAKLQIPTVIVLPRRLSVPLDHSFFVFAKNEGKMFLIWAAAKHLGGIMAERSAAFFPCLVPLSPPQGLAGEGGLGRRVTRYCPQGPGTAASHCCLWPRAPRRQLP